MSTYSHSWTTWSPYQSSEVREICAHMTDAERAEISRRGGLYGVWAFATFAGPLMVLFTSGRPVLMVIAGVLIAIHALCVPVWLRAQKRFLCSTAWAREQGFTPERLRMFAFRR